MALLGRNVPSDQPPARPWVFSHEISPANGWETGTSLNGAVAGAAGLAGPFSIRYRNAAIASRLTGAAGRNVPSA